MQEKLNVYLTILENRINKVPKTSRNLLFSLNKLQKCRKNNAELITWR